MCWPIHFHFPSSYYQGLWRPGIFYGNGWLNLRLACESCSTLIKKFGRKSDERVFISRSSYVVVIQFIYQNRSIFIRNNICNTLYILESNFNRINEYSRIRYQPCYFVLGHNRILIQPHYIIQYIHTHVKNWLHAVWVGYVMIWIGKVLKVVVYTCRIIESEVPNQGHTQSDLHPLLFFSSIRY